MPNYIDPDLKALDPKQVSSLYLPISGYKHQGDV